MKEKRHGKLVRVDIDTVRRMEKLKARFGMSGMSEVVEKALDVYEAQIARDGGVLIVRPVDDPKKAKPTQHCSACAGKPHHNSPCPARLGGGYGT